MNDHKAEIYYYDIGDYLSREQKLNIISQFKSMENLPFTRCTPNEQGDWISQRSDSYGNFISLTDENNSFFTFSSSGVKSNRMAWTSNSSLSKLKKNLQSSVDFYNKILESLKQKNEITISDLPDNSDKIKWDAKVIDKIQKKQKLSLNEENIKVASLRPFFYQHFYLDNVMCWSMYKIPSLYPENKKNVSIVITKDTLSFSCLVTNKSFDYQYFHNGVSFPLYYYERIESDQIPLLGDTDTKIIRHEAISDLILDRAQQKYGNKVQKEDIFYYVYGILHSKSYRETFSADLKKMLPRIPLVSDFQKFWDFSKAGRALAELHLNYESVEPYPDVKVESLRQVQYNIPQQDGETDNRSIIAADSLDSDKIGICNEQDNYAFYAVEKMRFSKKGEKGTIIYNRQHTITNIPEKAYEYVVNGKSAIEWIMERYAITTDKKSGITNNPNDWSREHQKPRYILDLLLSIINVSVQTVDIVNGLPEVDWEKE